MPEPVALFLRHTVRAGQRAAVQAVWHRHMAPAVATNPEHRAYAYCEDADDPEAVCAFQAYDSPEAASAFLRTEAYAAYLREVEPLLEGPPAVTRLAPVWTKGLG
ncbi:MAG: antibiotic biosynthesis monooxygenase [Rhodothermales bacterium]|nr:antibiotic biosynthesis monooxygenase [Rhodothermales bacterium]